MFRLADAQYLYLLVVVGALVGLWFYYRLVRGRRVERFGHPDVVVPLMGEWSSRKAMTKFVLLIVAVGLIVLSMARPQTGSRLREQKNEGIQLVLAIDVSRSMLAEDFSPNRLERTKYEISRLLEKLSKDNVGLVVFAGNSFVQLPLTSDFVSAASFVRDLSTDMVSDQGTSISSAITTAIGAFPQSEANNGKSKAIILITDGESHDDNPVEAAQAAADAGITIHTIGVGTPEGSPINIGGEMIKDENGEVVVSKLDQATLQDIASATGGLYASANDQEVGLSQIYEQIQKMEKQKYSTMAYDEYTEQFYYLIYIVLGLLLVELIISEKRIRRRV